MTPKTMSTQKTVLITGASRGIGYELARVFGREGYRLVLVARDRERLEDLARQFKAEYGVFVKIIVADLSLRKGVAEVTKTLEKDGIEVTVLVNNAGFGLFGDFGELDLKEQVAMMELNMMALVKLTHSFLPQMRLAKHGKILNVASTASFLSGPYMAVYYATKNFVLSFSEALGAELAGSGVTVTTLCPGPTDTVFPERAGAAHSKIFQGRLSDPAEVADQAYQALQRGQALVIPGWFNKLAVNLPRFLPRSWVMGLVKRIQDGKKV